ncbi:metal ABC transporter substrate-binding protein [Actinoplanes sp. N902-109]|uniref:metal ABC transporter substrate-binding protein n=1 Tax=Actinoplanes sp. (strain N902-109) TaxID=649831 RepID=UPI0005A16BF3|nr:metal ABC transporter substrate-binding protein [Actinoplanes sp. N902-109]
MPSPSKLLASAFAVLLLAGCAERASGFSAGRLDVVTAFYPLQFLAERIGGAEVTVVNLTKPGAEPHDVELTPRQVGRVADAGLAIYLTGFQPAVDQAVEQEAPDRALDVGTVVPMLHAEEEHAHDPGGEEEHAEGGLDPHVWLDPQRYATIADAVGARLARVDPAHAAAYTSRAQAVHAELAALDADFSARLTTCRRREVVTSHEAFHYLADRYGLTEVGITGISPEAEPSPRRLAHVAEEARATGTTTIFFETLVSPKVAETIAREVGARTAVLDPLEGVSEPGEDYFSVMRANLTALTTALGCSS